MSISVRRIFLGSWLYVCMLTHQEKKNVFQKKIRENPSEFSATVRFIHFGQKGQFVACNKKEVKPLISSWSQKLSKKAKRWTVHYRMWSLPNLVLGRILPNRFYNECETHRCKGEMFTTSGVKLGFYKLVMLPRRYFLIDFLKGFESIKRTEL